MKKILVIDDDPLIRESTSKILELAYYKPITASNGKSGLEMAVKEKPDLIICDIKMPEMNGYEVLYLLSKNPSTVAIPFIFLSAKKDHDDLRKGMNQGADDYLFKPFEELELLTSIEARLRKSERLNQMFSGKIDDVDEFIASLNGVKELNMLSYQKKVYTRKKKEMIYSEGDEAHSIVFIKKGIVKTFTMNEAGKEIITGLHYKGEFLGPFDLLESNVYRESAMATEDSEIIFILKNTFFSLLSSNRDVAVRFIHLLSNNIYQMQERLLHIAYDSVRRRTALALLSLIKSSGRKNSVKKICISRDDLAAVIGITPESTSRTLHDFKEEQLIHFDIGDKHKEIVILKVDKLKNMKN